MSLNQLSSRELESHCLAGLIKYPDILPEIDNFISIYTLKPINIKSLLQKIEHDFKISSIIDFEIKRKIIVDITFSANIYKF